MMRRLLDVLTVGAVLCIVGHATPAAADLIVLGSHGYKTWERLLLGSVSNSVVHHAPCSVLIVRSPAE